MDVPLDAHLMHLTDQHHWQRYELYRRHEQSFPSPILLSGDLIDDLRELTEHRLPDLCLLDGETTEMTRGTKFFCTIKDILTSDGEFWVEREFSPENERKFQKFIDILSLFAVSYESLKQVHVGQLVALHYDSAWHRALVVSKSEQTRPPASARVRLVDYGSSLYVNVVQLKWLPEQFYLFPFKAMECVFSEAVKPTFSDTVRLTFKQLVLNKRLRATVFDRDGTRLCILLKCQTDEGTVNVYRYLRAHEHKSNQGRMLPDGEIVSCLRQTLVSHSHSLDQSVLSTLTPPSPVKLTREELQLRLAEIKKLSAEPFDVSHDQSTPFSASTVITPMPRLSFAQQ